MGLVPKRQKYISMSSKCFAIFNAWSIPIQSNARQIQPDEKNCIQIDLKSWQGRNLLICLRHSFRFFSSKSKLWINNIIEIWCRLWSWSKTTNSRKVNKSGECLLQLSSSQPLPGLSQLLYLFVYFLLWKALWSKHDQNFQSRKVSFERERLSKQ